MPFLSLVTLAFDLQTRPSEGPNASSVWICLKSVQWFRRYFIHKQKNHRRMAPKTEPSAVHCVQYRVVYWSNSFFPLTVSKHRMYLRGKNNCCRLWFLQESILKTLQDSVEAEEEKNTQQLQSYETKLQSVNGVCMMLTTGAIRRPLWVPGL